MSDKGMHIIRLRSLPRVAAVLAVVALIAASCSSGSSGSSSGASSGALDHATVSQACEAGAKEGQVNYSNGTDPQDFAELVKPFEAKYPDIKVKFASVKPTQNTQQILAVAQSGRDLNVDGTYFEYNQALPMITAGLVAQVDWKALGVADDLMFTTPEGLTVPRAIIRLVGLSYNTQKISESELPSTWQDLINSKWAPNKVADDPLGKYLAPLAMTWGEDKAVAWYADFLKTVKPIIINGATDSLQKVISGEILLSADATNAEVGEQKAAGAPIALKYLDVVPADPSYVWVFKKAPHPNAARCFFAWLVSPEGQAQTQKVEFKSNTIPPDISSKVTEIKSAEDATALADATQKFTQMTKEYTG